MNILGIGPLELLLIMVLALVVLGPEKLPGLIAQVGKTINDLRRLTSQLSDEFNQTLQAELNETRSVVEDTKQTFKDAQASWNDAVNVGSAAPSGASSAAAPVVAEPPAALPIAAPHDTESNGRSNGTTPPAGGTTTGAAAPSAAVRQSPDELLPPY